MNCSTRTLTTVLALSAFAVTGVAQAAPAKPSVSAGSGALQGSSVAFTVNNKSAYKVSGKVALSNGRVAAGKRAYRAKAKSSAKVSVPLSAAAKSALARNGSLKLTVKTSAQGGGKTVVRTSSVTIRKAAGNAPAAKPITQLGPSSTGSVPQPTAQGGAPAQGNPGGGNPDPQPQPAPVDWRGGEIMGGSYDDFTFSTYGGQLTLTSVPEIGVKCSYTSSGHTYTVNSVESFDQPGPWTIGQADETRTATTIPNNATMSGTERTVTYKMSSVEENADRITGSMSVSFFRYETSGTPGKPGYFSRYTSCGGSLPWHSIKK